MKSVHYGILGDVFKNSILNFYAYRDFEQMTYEKDKEFSLEELPRYLLSAEKYQERSKEHTPVFALNNLRKNYRVSQNFESANVCFIDYDFKNEIQVQDFKDQYKKYNPSKSLKENVDQFKIDMAKYAWITANSFSGKGVRFIFVIINKIGDETINTILSTDAFTANDIHKSNIEYVNDLMFDVTGVLPNDTSVNSINLTTLPCRKMGSIITDVCHLKSFKFSTKNLKSKQYKTKTNEEVISENQSVKLDYDWNKLDEINNQDFHYDDILPFLSALQVYKDIDIREKFYHFLKRNYSGKAFKKILYTFNTFSKYLDNVHFSEYNITMKWCFERLGIFKKNKDCSETKDVFGYEYTKIIEIDDYIENFDFLYNTTGNTIINAGTGYGKTTQAVIYLNSIKGIRIFVAPTNVILEQTIPKCIEKNIEYVAYYSKSKKDISIEDDSLIITNYQNLNKLSYLIKNRKCSSIIIDEAHKITDYSTFDKDNRNIPLHLPNSKQNVFISATPEHYLIGAEKSNYIKFEKKITDKRDVNIIYFKSKKVMFDMIGSIIKQQSGKINIVFNNNKNENTTYREYLKNKYNVDMELVSSEDKGSVYQDIISNSKVDKNIITTSILNDGVNINNQVDNVFIIDNNSQSVFDIYQFSNRPRNSSPEIFIMRLIRFDKDYELRDKDIKTYFEMAFNKKMGELVVDLQRINQSNTNASLDILDCPYIYRNMDIYYINENLVKYDIVNDFKNKVQGSYSDYRYFIGNFFNIKKEIYIKSKSDVGFEKPSMKLLKPFILNHYSDWLIQGKINIENPSSDESDWILGGQVNSEKLSPEECSLYKKYKGSIEIYMKRYNILQGFQEFDVDSIFLKNDDFKKYLKMKRIQELKLHSEVSKLDNEMMNDINEINRIIATNNELDYFKEEIVNVGLLNSNKFDLRNTKSINKGLKTYGYMLERKTIRNNKEIFNRYYIVRQM